MNALVSFYSVSSIFFIFHKKPCLSIILIGNSADNLRQGMKGRLDTRKEQAATGCLLRWRGVDHWNKVKAPEALSVVLPSS
jgi:hypothetical protein